MRALAQSIACEIHPLNNLRVLRYLTHDLKIGEDDKNRWYRHWVETGLEVVERQLAAQPATYCHGDTPTLADLTLGDRIMVQRSEHTVRFLHPEGWNYFDTLRKKMHWNEGA